MAGKEKEKERNWDREMAEVDKLLSKLPEADPYLGSAATVRRPAVAGGGGAPHGVAPGGLSPGGGHRLGTWVRVGLGLALGIGMAAWPYTHGCGLRLIFYLIGAGTVVIAGVWSAISSWRHRLALAHGLSLVVTLWGLVLAAREILPRVGYAKQPATWLCH